MTDDDTGRQTVDLQGWSFDFPTWNDESFPQEAVIRSPSGEELRLTFTDDIDELYSEPVWWLVAAINDAKRYPAWRKRRDERRDALDRGEDR